MRKRKLVNNQYSVYSRLLIHYAEFISRYKKRRLMKFKTIKLIGQNHLKKSRFKDVLNQRYADISFWVGVSCGWVESWLIGNCPYCGKSISIENSTYSCKRCGQILKWKE